LSGGSGADILEGNLGADTLEGGADTDTFVWNINLEQNGGIDHITDFDTEAGDVIRLQGITSDSGIYDFDTFIAASRDTAQGVFVSFEGDANGFFIEGVTLADRRRRRL
jgi:Ca2+-binding RTX toxin-like protein